MIGAYQFLKKYGVAIGFGFGAFLSILTYVFILGGYPDGSPTESELYEKNIFDFGILSAKYLVYLAVFLVFAFFIKEAAENPQGSMKPLVGMVVLVVLYFVTQAMGDGTLTLDMVNTDVGLLEGKKFDPGVSQSADVAFSDGLIKFAYVMLVGVGLSWVFGLVYGFIKQ